MILFIVNVIIWIENQSEDCNVIHVKFRDNLCNDIDCAKYIDGDECLSIFNAQLKLILSLPNINTNDIMDAVYFSNRKHSSIIENNLWYTMKATPLVKFSEYLNQYLHLCHQHHYQHALKLAIEFTQQVSADRHSTKHKYNQYVTGLITSAYACLKCGQGNAFDAAMTKFHKTVCFSLLDEYSILQSLRVLQLFNVTFIQAQMTHDESKNENESIDMNKSDPPTSDHKENTK